MEFSFRQCLSVCTCNIIVQNIHHLKKSQTRIEHVFFTGTATTTASIIGFLEAAYMYVYFDHVNLHVKEYTRCMLACTCKPYHTDIASHDFYSEEETIFNIKMADFKIAFMVYKMAMYMVMTFGVVYHLYVYVFYFVASGLLMLNAGAKWLLLCK